MASHLCAWSLPGAADACFLRWPLVGLPHYGSAGGSRGVWGHHDALHKQRSQSCSEMKFPSTSLGRSRLGWRWFVTGSFLAEVLFLTWRLNLWLDFYFCSDWVFPVLLAKWSALMLVLARSSHEMKSCPSQTSPAVPFHKGIAEHRGFGRLLSSGESSPGFIELLSHHQPHVLVHGCLFPGWENKMSKGENLWNLPKWPMATSSSAG